MPTQSHDISASPYAIGYGAIGETWKILKGVDVQGTMVGVYSDYVDSKLVNSGSIFGSVGVIFEAGGAPSAYVVNNQKKGEIVGEVGINIEDYAGSALVKNKGEIQGAGAGIEIADFTGSAKIVNKGKIDGGELAVHVEGSTDVAIVNKGDISGGLAGIILDPDALGAKGPFIENHGTIEAFYYGLVIQGGAGVDAKVVNHKGGVIDGNFYALASEDKLSLTNKGKIEGNIVSSDYDDKVINKGKIKGDVSRGDGNDIFKNKGKGKSDLIDTGDGNDLVVFGKKADKLLFDSTLNSATNVDTVKKFESGKDMIHLDVDVFSTIAPGTLTNAQFHKGTSAADADDRIIYDKASGALYYDADGTGGTAQVQFAKFDPGTKVKAGDFTIGEYNLMLIS